MSKNKIILFDIDHTLFDTEKFKASKFIDYPLYDEVLEVLKKLSKIAKLGILSQGELEFQKTKLRNTKIGHFFKEHNVHISEDKNLNLEKVLSKYKNYETFFIDDRLSILRSAKKFMPSIITIWIRRGPHAERQGKITGFIPDETVLSLQELGRLIT